MKIAGEKGLTLLEVLVAIAILGILMGGLLNLLQTENQVIRMSAELLSARLKANEAMEQVKATPFDDLKSFSSLVVSELKHMTVNVEVSNYSIREKVEERRSESSDEGAEANGLKKIVVSVKWFDQQGHERQYILTTLRTRYHQRSQS